MLNRARSLAAALAFATVPFAVACDDGIESQDEDITNVNNSSVKNQSIGNCWVYASVGWAESLRLTHSGEQLNLSESYISYWHWYEEIAGAPPGQTSLAQLDKGQISTGGWFGLAGEIMRRYGVMDEGAFIAEEAEAARSSRQSSALNAINASLKSGALKDAAARRDRKLVRQELDKAWGLTPEVSQKLDSIFGADVSKTLLSSGVSVGESGLRFVKDIEVGSNGITLSDAIGTPASSFNVLQRKGKYAWNEVNFPTGDTARRDFYRKMQEAMHSGMPVILVWFVDFAALDSQNRFFAPPTTPGRQGMHMTVVEDYQASNVPGFGTLEAGTVVTDQKALDAALSPEATIDFIRIKNSWGTSLAPSNAGEDLRGYHDLYSAYLNGPLTKCTESNGDKCGIKSKVPGLSSMVLPPAAFVTDALVKEGACTDICVAGPARQASCDTCTDLICSEDAFCCNNSWDDVCVNTAKEICEVQCGN
ncbi:MAG: hypothetical protein HOW73_50075 [Polyangiaceae bacterium]|nr:hypothetical protein [Polyangiaceae bacterium]